MSGSPVIMAKLLRPEVVDHGADVRVAAEAALAAGLERGFVIVAARPGFARRDLVIRWCEANPDRASAWLELDGLDDPIRLYRHIAASLRGVDPSIGATADAIAAEGVDRVVEHGIPTLAADVDAWGQEVTLVLDGVERLQPASREGVLTAVRYRPPNLRLVLITRDDASLMVRGRQATVAPPRVTERELRMGPVEAGAVLAHHGVDASPTELLALVERTDGWPYGIWTVARASQDAGRLVDVDAAGAGVAAFVHETTCRTLDPDVRAFLGDLAVIEPADVDLCVEVTGRLDAGRLVRRLRELHLVDDRDPGRLQVAPEVRDHLLQERRGTDALVLGELQRLAAVAHLERHRVAEALTVLARSGDLDTMVGFLLAQHRQWSAAGHAASVRRHVGEALARDPSRVELFLVRAWAEVFDGATAEAGATCDLATTLPIHDASTAALVRSEVEVLRGIIARRAGRMDDALVHVLAGVDAGAGLPAAGPGGYLGVMPAMAHLYLGHALFHAGEIDDARAELHEANVARTWSPVALANMHGTLALVGWLRDEPSAAIHASIAASHLDDRLTDANFIAAAALALVGTSPDAVTIAERFLGAAEQFDEPAATVLAHVVRAVRAVDDTEAHRALAAARQVIERLEQPGVLPSLVARAASTRGLGADTPGLGDELTDGERRVLRALRGDLTEREIAAELHLSHNTVRAYRRRAYRKLGVVSRADAVDRLAALESGDLTEN